MEIIKKYLKILANIFLAAIIILLIVSSSSSWQDQREFSRGEKNTAIAKIEVDRNNVKTYNFSENSYGVDASKSKFKNNDTVKVYFLKKKPYIVSENPYIYHSTTEIIIPIILSGIFSTILIYNFSKKKGLLDNNP